jgi:prephenate dehydratase
MMQPKKIAIQGVAGAFHEVAAQKYFGQNIVPVECDTFRILAHRLAAGEVDFAVMAIENTIAGTLLPNYSLINEFDLKVVGEVYLHIEMQLMALPGVQLPQVAYIHSHPIAIAQCREFLDALPPAVTVIEKNDTAESAQLIVKNKLADTAAIAGSLAAEMYGLHVIARNIHTCKENFTRFLALSRRPCSSDRNNKASICLEVAHRSGSLAKVLGIWAKNGVNLTKIQSIPIIGKPYQYSFYIDLEWSDSAAYRQAIDELAPYTTNQYLLGEYERDSWEES